MPTTLKDRVHEFYWNVTEQAKLMAIAQGLIIGDISKEKAAEEIMNIAYEMSQGLSPIIHGSFHAALEQAKKEGKIIVGRAEGSKGVLNDG